MKIRSFLSLATAAIFAPALWAAPLQLQKGDQIAIVGSGFADRQQHHAWLETLIQKAHPWDPLESTCRHASLSIL